MVLLYIARSSFRHHLRLRHTCYWRIPGDRGVEQVMSVFRDYAGRKCKAIIPDEIARVKSVVTDPGAATITTPITITPLETISTTTITNAAHQAAARDLVDEDYFISRETIKLLYEQDRARQDARAATAVAFLKEAREQRAIKYLKEKKKKSSNG